MHVWYIHHCMSVENWVLLTHNETDYFRYNGIRTLIITVLLSYVWCSIFLIFLQSERVSWQSLFPGSYLRGWAVPPLHCMFYSGGAVFQGRARSRPRAGTLHGRTSWRWRPHSGRSLPKGRIPHGPDSHPRLLPLVLLLCGCSGGRTQVTDLCKTSNFMLPSWRTDEPASVSHYSAKRHDFSSCTSALASKIFLFNKKWLSSMSKM